jgi:hypothetical protein
MRPHDDDRPMDQIRMSRALLAFTILVVMVGGVLLGSLTTRIAGLGETPTPTPLPLPSPSASLGPELPISDVEGDEIERLPRYPGSVRSEYEVMLDDRFRLLVTEYLADAPLDEVRAYYEGVIDDHGWSRADINYAAGEWTYVLVDGSTEALIELEVTNGLVEIDLQLSEPIAASEPDPTSTPTPTPMPTARPATPAPVVPAPAPPGDDDDDGAADDTGDDGGSGG